jgi:hypothetical protein
LIKGLRPDLRVLHFFLGIEVSSHDTSLLLTQSSYILSILQKAKMQDAKPVTTPMAMGHMLSKYDGESMEDPHLFRSIVGALQYITITCPDVSFAVNRVS